MSVIGQLANLLVAPAASGKDADGKGTDGEVPAFTDVFAEVASGFDESVVSAPEESSADSEAAELKMLANLAVGGGDPDGEPALVDSAMAFGRVESREDRSEPLAARTTMPAPAQGAARPTGGAPLDLAYRILTAGGQVPTVEGMTTRPAEADVPLDGDRATRQLADQVPTGVNGNVRIITPPESSASEGSAVRWDIVAAARPAQASHPAMAGSPASEAPAVTLAGTAAPPAQPPATVQATPIAPNVVATQAAADARTLAPQVTPQLAQVVRVAETRGGHEIRVGVAPETLGPVTVKATVDSAGAMRIELSAPTEQARAALHALVTDLRRDLAGITGSGYQASITVADGSTSGAASQQGTPGGGAGAGSAGQQATPSGHDGSARGQGRSEQPDALAPHGAPTTPDSHDPDAPLDVIA